MGQIGLVFEAEKAKWGPLWNFVNDTFNDYMSSRQKLQHLHDAKFYVYDGNHYCIVWMRHIKRLYSTIPKWHITVDSIVLDTKGQTGALM